MLRNRNTKIIATLGPSSSSPVKIHSLFQAGADIFRLNFSHGTHEDHRRRVFHIRQYEKRLGRPIAILGDLQGPKFRIGNFKKGFDEHEWRWKTDKLISHKRHFLKPEWDGEKKIYGKKIMLWSEQGIGDTILWSSALSYISSKAQSCT